MVGLAHAHEGPVAHGDSVAGPDDRLAEEWEMSTMSPVAPARAVDPGSAETTDTERLSPLLAKLMPMSRTALTWRTETARRRRLLPRSSRQRLMRRLMSPVDLEQGGAEVDRLLDGRQVLACERRSVNIVMSLCSAASAAATWATPPGVDAGGDGERRPGRVEARVGDAEAEVADHGPWSAERRHRTRAWTCWRIPVEESLPTAIAVPACSIAVPADPSRGPRRRSRSR